MKNFEQIVVFLLLLIVCGVLFAAVQIKRGVDEVKRGVDEAKSVAENIQNKKMIKDAAEMVVGSVKRALS